MIRTVTYEVIGPDTVHLGLSVRMTAQDHVKRRLWFHASTMPAETRTPTRHGIHTRMSPSKPPSWMGPG